MVDFGNVHDTIETQAFDLAEDATGEIWYPVRVAKFTSVRSLAIFFPDSVGGEETAVVSGARKLIKRSYGCGLVLTAVCLSVAFYRVQGHVNRAPTGSREKCGV